MKKRMLVLAVGRGVLRDEKTYNHHLIMASK